MYTIGRVSRKSKQVRLPFPGEIFKTCVSYLSILTHPVPLQRLIRNRMQTFAFMQSQWCCLVIYRTQALLWFFCFSDTCNAISIPLQFCAGLLVCATRLYSKFHYLQQRWIQCITTFIRKFQLNEWFPVELTPIKILQTVSPSTLRSHTFLPDTSRLNQGLQ